MEIEAAQALAEAFQGVGEGATSAFIVWVVFDFLKASMAPLAWIGFFVWGYKPALRAIKTLWSEDKE